MKSWRSFWWWWGTEVELVHAGKLHLYQDLKWATSVRYVCFYWLWEKLRWTRWFGVLNMKHQTQQSTNPSLNYRYAKEILKSHKIKHAATFHPFLDHPELYAQVPAETPHRQSGWKQRFWFQEHGLLYSRLPRDGLHLRHLLSKPQGMWYQGTKVYLYLGTYSGTYLILYVVVALKGQRLFWIFLVIIWSKSHFFLIIIN